jgi:hypothetical protein
LEEAGRILVEMIDRDALAKEKLLEAFPDLSSEILDTFERIGRKQLYHRLCLTDGPGVRALRRCPYSDQVRFASEGVPILLLGGSAGDFLKVSVFEMDSEYAKQAFGNSKVRSLAEQRVFLERSRSKPRAIEISEPYTLAKGKITFHEPVTLTAQDMARLLAQIA